MHGSETSGAVPIRPERLFRMVGEEMADDAVVVGDTGHVGAWSARHLRLRAGQSIVRAAGSLGWGLPASLGVKCACPDREVICVTGDGGFFYHIAELETARRYGLNVIVVVNNNTSLNQEQFLWELDSADQDRNWRFHDTDLVADRAGLRLPRRPRGRSRRLRRGPGQGPGIRAARGDRRPDRQRGHVAEELRPGTVGDQGSDDDGDGVRGGCAVRHQGG